MNEDFFRHIFQKQQDADEVPSNKEISRWASDLIRLIFPEQSKRPFGSIQELKDQFKKHEDELSKVMVATKACEHCNHAQLSKAFFSKIPEIYRVLNTDI